MLVYPLVLITDEFSFILPLCLPSCRVDRLFSHRILGTDQRDRQRQGRTQTSIPIDPTGLSSTQKLSPCADVTTRGPRDATFEAILQTCEIYDTPSASQRVFVLASMAYLDYTMHAPRPSQLPFLISLNINIAVAKNASLMGFEPGIICADASISPFNQEGPPQPHVCLPPSLAPSQIQRNITHHPWLDVLPFPNLRDNVIRAVAAGLVDEDELCADTSEINYENAEKPSLIVWGESSVPDCWEASVLFIRKWGWLLKGCPEVLESTNRWRQSRGEKSLYWHDLFPAAGSCNNHII